MNVERLFLVTLMILYGGFSLWTWTLVEPESGSSPPRIQMSGPEKPKVTTTSHTTNPLESLSSVDFYACCGLGHRLIRMSLAAYVAKQHNFSLRSFWGWCGERNPVEVFSYLFRPYHPSEVAYVQSQNLLLPFYNEVPGFPALVRTGSGTTTTKTTTTTTTSTELCPCGTDKIESDLELYESLRTRFRYKHRVDDFVQRYFTNATVLGIHVRSGNGESGDFERKSRDIADPDSWVHQVRLLLQQSLLSRPLVKDPLIFLATDTPSMVTRFRKEFALINVSVVELQQEGRTQEGGGVLFGTSNRVYNTDDNTSHFGDDSSSCLQGWTDTFTDMVLLSHADIVIAGRPSSFVQTLPMSLAYGKSKQNKIWKDVYCEIIPQFQQKVMHTTNDSTSSNMNDTTSTVGGTKDEEKWVEVDPTIQCYDSYQNWCCNHSTWIQFHHTGPKGHSKVLSKEFVRFPSLLPKLHEYKGLRNRTTDCRLPKRGRAGGGWKDKCLPHEWIL
ncbi:Nodulation protein Z NodZ [Nitzschia inconspicua]|uniref:Nodulation protein Z NodZ n=1 Tax=Nitzschia inconspicua TaxID=303405 RepID=A0A9K3KWD3_9STRA|nr:Nodulation protein Z NodZ [Nitzschia inconspicua]